jgi:Ca-activated chloride channel family protein
MAVNSPAAKRVATVAAETSSVTLTPPPSAPSVETAPLTVATVNLAPTPAPAAPVVEQARSEPASSVPAAVVADATSPIVPAVRTLEAETGTSALPANLGVAANDTTLLRSPGDVRAVISYRPPTHEPIGSILPAAPQSLAIASDGVLPPAAPIERVATASQPAPTAPVTSEPFPPASPSSLVESARDALLRPLTFVPGAGLTANARLSVDNGFITAAQRPIATVAVESDTSSVSALRRFLQKKRLPPRDSVRIEELVNYFPYHYPPRRGDAPFAASLEVADAPWAPTHRLVRIGLKAREAQLAPRAPANLVFVVDVVDVPRLSSRLPMIKDAIQSLVGKLRPDDRVALVSCHRDTELILPPTPAGKTREIVAALNRFTGDGTTSRMKGIQYAYDLLAAYNLSKNGRVILCTDGNAGLTITAEGPLARVIEAKTRAGVALTAFGFGMGIYRDPLIEFLAEWGSGSYGYIDSRRDAERMLAEDINGPAVTIAKDVKVEVEFNPARVASYRLLGYENRALGKDDFKAGSLAASEVSAGHAVTALFEIVPADGRAAVGASAIAGLRYQQPAKSPAIELPAPDQNELLTVKVRYKKPGGAIGQKLNLPLADARTRFVDASADFKFAAAVAGFGMVLRDSPHKGAATLAHVIEWAEAAALDDPDGNRAELIELAREAQALVR